jgi:predicted phosphoribosyltransferase
VVLAVPVAPPGWQERIGEAADEMVCVAEPPSFFAIGQFYATFSQVPDDDVIRLLRDALLRGTPPAESENTLFTE